MSSQLIARSPDLVRLRDNGYELEVVASHLLVGHIPYVNSGKEVAYGVLAVKLVIAGDMVQKPDTHVAYFIGDHPCNIDGTEITGLKHTTTPYHISDSLTANRSFSNKPPEGYPGYYEQITRYVEMITPPARAIDNTVTAQTYKIAETTEDESVFCYPDTASSRAGITTLTAKLELEKVAIVGLGGTGSYVLDLLAKCPVKEIHLFDGDRFLNHNAFRSPGAPTIEILRSIEYKVVYFRDFYSNMRRGIHAHPEYIDDSNVESLRGMKFVFICCDGGKYKKTLITRLEEWGTPFIDVGMGLAQEDGALSGLVRVTTSTPSKRDHVRRRVSLVDDVDDAYSTNIQIADLNCLNAALAVVKWKKLFGFYHDVPQEHNSFYNVRTGGLINGDQLGEQNGNHASVC